MTEYDVFKFKVIVSILYSANKVHKGIGPAEILFYFVT